MLERQKRVLEFWDRKLNTRNKDYSSFVKNLINILSRNDSNNADLTTNSIINAKKNITVQIASKEEGILAGLEELSLLNNDLKLKFLKKDGDKIKNNEVIAEIAGEAGKILSRERINLNLLQRMSGIATFTDSLNKKLKNKVKVAATRKTLFGMLDKKAVSIGGGLTHRLNLNDGILIKDNHLKILDYDIEKALNLTKNRSKHVEIEVEDKKHALKAANSMKKIIKKNNKNLFAMMLDKIPPKEIRLIIQELIKSGLYEGILIEASGNINESNINQYADCGADIISMGCLTNPGKSLNMSLEVL